MEETSDQPQVIIQNHPFPKPSIKFLIILFLVLMASVPIGIYLYTTFYNKQETRNFTPVPPKITSAKPKITIPCPIKKELCATAKIINEGDIQGIGFSLPEGTLLTAVLQGAVTDQPKITGRSDTEPLLYLGDDKGNQAIYSFYGTVSLKVPAEKITQGQELGKIGPGTFPPYPPLSDLNFFLVVKDKNNQTLDYYNNIY